MDRLAHTALNSLKMLMENQSTTAHNLANLNTPGYRQDVTTEFSSVFLDREEGIEPRILSVREAGGFSIEQGQMENTNNSLDIAISDDGYFIIQPPNGNIALSRRGDLQINDLGELTDGAGNKILDNGLQPIVIPAYTSIEISNEGQIRIKGLGDAADALPQNIGLIATFKPEGPINLKKSLDGKIRIENIDEEGNVTKGEIAPNQQAKILQGFLEKSNVNAIEEMVNSLDYQRKFEIHIKMIQLADEMDQAGSSLMRLPNF